MSVLSLMAARRAGLPVLSPARSNGLVALRALETSIPENLDRVTGSSRILFRVPRGTPWRANLPSQLALSPMPPMGIEFPQSPATPALRRNQRRKPRRNSVTTSSNF